MRDDVVQRFDSINALKQEMNTFGETEKNKDIKNTFDYARKIIEINNLKANLINALVKKSEAQGIQLPDRERKRPRKPRIRDRRPLWSI